MLTVSAETGMPYPRPTTYMGMWTSLQDTCQRLFQKGSENPKTAIRSVFYGFQTTMLFVYYVLVVTSVLVGDWQKLRSHEIDDYSCSFSGSKVQQGRSQAFIVISWVLQLIVLPTDLVYKVLDNLELFNEEQSRAMCMIRHAAKIFAFVITDAVVFAFFIIHQSDVCCGIRCASGNDLADCQCALSAGYFLAFVASFISMPLLGIDAYLLYRNGVLVKRMPKFEQEDGQQHYRLGTLDSASSGHLKTLEPENDPGPTSPDLQTLSERPPATTRSANVTFTHHLIASRSKESSATETRRRSSRDSVAPQADDQSDKESLSDELPGAIDGTEEEQQPSPQPLHLPMTFLGTLEEECMSSASTTMTQQSLTMTSNSSELFRPALHPCVYVHPRSTSTSSSTSAMLTTTEEVQTTRHFSLAIRRVRSIPTEFSSSSNAHTSSSNSAQLSNTMSSLWTTTTNSSNTAWFLRLTHAARELARTNNEEAQHDPSLPTSTTAEDVLAIRSAPVILEGLSSSSSLPTSPNSVRVFEREGASINEPLESENLELQGDYDVSKHQGNSSVLDCLGPFPAPRSKMVHGINSSVWRPSSKLPSDFLRLQPDSVIFDRPKSLSQQSSGHQPTERNWSSRSSTSDGPTTPKHFMDLLAAPRRAPGFVRTSISVVNEESERDSSNNTTPRPVRRRSFDNDVEFESEDQNTSESSSVVLPIEDSERERLSNLHRSVSDASQPLHLPTVQHDHLQQPQDLPGEDVASLSDASEYDFA